MTWEEVQIVDVAALVLDADSDRDDARADEDRGNMNCPHCHRAFALDLVGPQEISSRLGVEPQTVSMWKLRGLLPDPIATLSRVPIWDWSVIHAWAEETKRLANLSSTSPEPFTEPELRALADHAQHPNPEQPAEQCAVCRLVATANARRR